MESGTPEEIHGHVVELLGAARHVVERVGHDHLEVRQGEIEVATGELDDPGVDVHPGDPDRRGLAGEEVGERPCPQPQEEGRAGRSLGQHRRPVAEGWSRFSDRHGEDHAVHHQGPVSLVLVQLGRVGGSQVI